VPTRRSFAVRLLWISDNPTSPSGFGAVTGEVCSRLATRGHHVEILGWQQRGASARWRDIPVHPVRYDAFGADTIVGYLLRQRPDFVVTLADVWWMSFLCDPPVQRFLDQSGCRWVLYYPIDGADPEGTLPAGWRKVLQTADVPVAMSRFGAGVSAACGVESDFVPHGVDLDVFSPAGDKAAAKRAQSWSDRFVVLSDARNQPRKLLCRTLDVFARFARGRDDALLHLHCDPDDDAARSDLYRYDVRADVAALGLTDKVHLTDGFVMRTGQGLPVARLAALYQGADAHLLSSWGEGFGLPSLQAAAAGVVPVAADWSASAELVAGHGFAVAVESTMVDEFGLVRALLDRDAAADALARLHDDPAELAERSRRSREFALTFGWEKVVDGWEEVLSAAAPRRRPVRTRSFGWISGADEHSAMTDLPAPIVSAAADAFAPLPEGTKLSFQITERSYGEVAGEIRRGAFADGDELSIPVRLPAFFEGAPRPRVGNVMVAAADLPLAARLRRSFPGLAISLPQADGDPRRPVVLPLPELAPALVHCALVIDLAGGAPRGTDVACAALGVPFVGRGGVWPGALVDPFAVARRVLTDQGHSERRRRRAYERVRGLYGDEAIDRVRTLALAGQPEAQAAPA
jgi:glycosyltransferase involved in cell wall biosynthesis